MTKARIKNGRDYYGVIAITLHWLVFIMVVGLIASGKYSDSLPKPDSQVIGIHKQVGLVLFLLMAFRLIWRWFNQSPESLTPNVLIRFAAFVVHYLMYAVVFLQVYSGVLMTQLGGKVVTLFGAKLPEVFDGSNWLLGMMSFALDESPPVAKQMRELHGLLGDTFIVLIGAHIFGALFHHLRLGDDTLRRMFYRYAPAYAQKSHVKK